VVQFEFQGNFGAKLDLGFLWVHNEATSSGLVQQTEVKILRIVAGLVGGYALFILVGHGEDVGVVLLPRVSRV
jgi:hypothetical protein